MNRVQIVTVGAAVASLLVILVSVAIGGVDVVYVTPILGFALLGAAFSVGMRRVAQRRRPSAVGADAHGERVAFVEDRSTPAGDSSEHSSVPSDRGAANVPDTRRRPR